MKTLSRLFFVVLVLAVSAAGSRAASVSKEEVKKILEANPALVLDVLKQNREAFFNIVKDAAREDQIRQQKEQEEAEKKDFEESLKNPKKPLVDLNSIIRGNKKAKFTLVEYADFQCPFCSRVVPTVEALRKEHGDNLRVVFKTMPLVDIHPQAMPSAQYFEAIALQSQQKAWAFHDALFSNQDKLGEAFYKETAKNLGIDMKKLEQDIKGEAVKNHIAANTREFQSFGFSGTPAFLINGVPVRGAYPLGYFDNVFKRLEAQQSKHAN